MSSNTLKVLITRPADRGQKLTQQLQALGIIVTSQALFDYQNNSSQASLQQRLTNQPNAMIIFVSVAAVTHANATWPIAHWACKALFAVGSATQAALQALTKQSIICPNQHNSEGLLALPQLTQVRKQDIIIVRGDGGREYLAQQLKHRGANVSYIESYQRIWRTFSNNIAKQWQARQINCIVITSNALLERVIHLSKHTNKNWRDNCLWIVASKRIAEHAKQLGLTKIINANGANDQAILKALMTATE